MICGKCGTELPDDSKFCHNCGSKLETAAGGLCPKCGSPVQPGSKFCNKCGASLDGSATNQKNDTTEVEKICNRAFDLYINHNYDEAIAEYTRAIKLDPDCQHAYKWRGNCYFNTDELNKALADLNKAVRLNTGDADALSYRGKVYQKMGNYQEAFGDFNKAIKLESDVYSFYDDRASLYMELKIYTAAIEDYNKVLELLFANEDDENNKILIASTLDDRGDAYFQDAKYEKARKDYIRALQYADYWLLWYDKARAELQLENYGVAVSDFGAAINRYDEGDNEFLAELYDFRGIAYASSGDIDEALKCIERAIELDPGEKEYKEDLQKLLEERNHGDYDEDDNFDEDFDYDEDDDFDEDEDDFDYEEDVDYDDEF